MSNTLGNFNPVFYATQALSQLKMSLGMAGTVYRGFEQERARYGIGEYINLRRPATFTAASAPASTVQDLATESVQIHLNNWKEVTFGVTDAEKAYGGQRLIAEHIQPAAYAIGRAINSSLHALADDVPWFHDIQSTPDVTDVINPSKSLFQNGVLRDPSNLFFAVDPTFGASLKGLAAFSQNQGSAGAGVQTQITGLIGTRYGMQFYETQEIPSHTKGTASTGTLALNGAHSRGATTIAADAGSVTGTLVAGDTFVIAGNTQRYAVTATSTASGNAFASISITPALVADYADDAVITVRLDNHTENLAYHRNAFALVIVPMDDQNPGGSTFTAVDEESGLSVRAAIQWSISSKKTLVSLDALWGVKTINPNMAVRVCG